ncbi:RagB/SusD family nutrient uptake outer membrane protein [Flavobacterium cellulosilyticum]|uniref:RagB/SusD family nutrient uptake outer membrane protein n=1 Tax=Flavobacterium cellulosilyticum TaxID=2541731 RepID=A0A4R5C7K9_9FLAO|nr:RagB/SusD family nutrient uptake outer membrane protein [Flavobacterium cellulosilyticum]
MTTIRTKIKNSTVVGLWLMTIVVSLHSCQDYLDVQPQDKLSGDQVYRNIYDADAAVVGIYGKFMGLAEKYVILNEMRADLMTTTRNSSPYLKEISEHNVSANNPYANPKDYYEVILNCNDVLKNFDIMLANKKFTQAQYNQRYADIGALRSWVYLQLGIQYGNVPYITDPIENLDDVKNSSKYPRIPFDQLLDKLLTFTTTLTYTSPYDSANTLNINVDGYNTAKFFVNKECLLGDLNLWKGNYNEAAKHYKTVMETSTNSGTDTERYDNYRIKYAEVATNNDFAVGYVRYSEQDARSLINNNTQGWRSMFARSRDVLWNTEWIWSLPFDSKFSPKNPFIDIFSNRSGLYLAKPSQQAISLWNNNKQRNGFPYDARGQKFSYTVIDGDEVIMKYLYKFLNPVTLNPADAFQTGGDWFLYRAAKLHLRYAEAANRDNKHKIADAILNFGIKAAYDVPGTIDVTNIQKTKDAFPYDFDARQGDFPFYRGNWYRGTGIRGRAYLERAPVVGDSLISIENNIINEDALELAYEGNRWEDLVRVALRRKNPAFLADKVYDKLNKEGNSQASSVRTKLMNVNNWYLPFTWQ